MSLITTPDNVRFPVDGPKVPGLSADKFETFRNNSEQLIRHGGEIRWKAGAPDGKGGQIFGLVRDVGGGGQQVMAKASKMALGLSGVGAAASVANLAVSAVGFYVLNDKINKLQEEMDQLHNAVSEGFERMEKRFVQVQHLLGDLKEGQQKLLEGQEHIQDQNEAASFAPVMTVLQRLEECREKERTPSANQTDRWLDKARDARNTFGYMVDKWCTGEKPADSLGFARATGYYQLWASALIAEARLLRLVDRTAEASDMVYEALEDWYYPRVRKTAELLLDFDVGILLSGPFEGRVNTDQYFDLRELLKGDRASVVEREQWLSEADEEQRREFGYSPRERLKAMRSIDARGKYSKATQVYSLLETGRRLNTLALEYAICARQDLSSSDWEDRQSSDGDLDDVKLIQIS